VNYIRNRLYLPLFTALDSMELYSGDLKKVRGFYDEKGYSISNTKLLLTSLSGVFLSGSFYNAIKHAYWNYYSSGTPEYNAYEWYGFKIPDVLTYMNSNGVSYHVSSGYRFSNTLIFPFALEANILGDFKIEGTVGVVKKFPNIFNLDIRAEGRFGSGGVDGGVKASITPYGSTFCEVGVNVYHPKNLEGGRQILSLKSGKHHAEVYVKVGLLF
jgi:hypothetical protein